MIGPYGGKVLHVAIDPRATSTAYALTDAGVVFRSDDGASTWHHASDALVARSQLAFAIDDTSDPSTIYAHGGINLINSPEGADLLKSTDRGETWSVITPPSEDDDLVVAVAIDRVSVPSVIYVSTSAGEVFRSDDHGKEWSDGTAGLVAEAVTALAADPLAADTVYAATDRGVYKTTDGARSWTLVSPEYLGVDVLVVDSHTAPATLYAASGGYLWTSLDGGASWSYDTGVPNHQVFDLQIDARQQPLVVYAFGFIGADFAISRQGSAGWQRVARGSAPSLEEGFAIGGGTLLLATDCEGVLHSRNGGASWELANVGLSAMAVNALAIGGGAQADTLYAATSCGVFRTRLRDVAWELWDDDLTAEIDALAVDRTVNPNVLYAVGSNGNDSRGDIFTRTTASPAWSLARPSAGAVAVALDTTTQPAGVFVATFRGILGSRDAGVSWQPLQGMDASVQDVVVDPSTHPPTLHAVTDAGLVSGSADGTTWRTDGILDALLHKENDASISGIGFDAHRQRILLGLSGLGIVQSAAHGRWPRAGTGLPRKVGGEPVFFFPFAFDTSTGPSTAYVGAGFYFFGSKDIAGVWKRRGASHRWQPVGRGLPSRFDIVGLAVDDSTKPGTLYAGTYGEGVLRLVPRNPTRRRRP